MRRQRGIAALEMALILPTLMTLLAVVLYYGRLTHHYEVVQKALQAGTRYLSSAPLVNLKTPALATQESALTQAIVQAELDTLGSGAAIVVTCNGVPCALLNGIAPTEISVTVIVDVPNIFPGYVQELLEQRLWISRSVRYVGN